MTIACPQLALSAGCLGPEEPDSIAGRTILLSVIPPYFLFFSFLLVFANAVHFPLQLLYYTHVAPFQPPSLCN